MSTRSWPIRSKIHALVIVPLAALMALWIFATTLTLGPALNLLAAQALLDNVGVPGEALVRELRQERRLTLIFLAGGGEADLRQQRERTDEVIAEFQRRATSESVRDKASDLLNARIDQTLAALGMLPTGRSSVDQRQMDKTAALSLYNSVVSSLFQTFSAMVALPDEEISRRARALTALGQARELLSQSDALLAAVFTAGRFDEGEHGQLVQLIGARRFLSETAVADLPQADRAAYRRMTETEAFVRLHEMENELAGLTRSRALPDIDAEAWQSTHEAVQQQMREFELSASDRLAEESIPVAVGVLLRLGFAGVLGLVAVIASVVVSVRIGRNLVRRLTGLRSAALELAEERLPTVVARLRRGEEVDIAAETPALEYGDDEIGQVAMAFREVQRTAVQSAIDEAHLRQGLNQAFLNIARRSQALLHRQLALLDRMERRTTDPEELEDLFRVDHLATRMRRHSEDLVILAGASSGRTWRNPIPMIDVIRGAVSEVEDYVRVDVTSVEPAATVGRAVADVIHLLAELVENATLFSPPQTRVRISGQSVPNGYAIEIEDRGLGMTPEAIEEANERLANPPEFDPASSARLGLFVVSRLAARHGVQVRLRPSPFGGITAVVLLPPDLVVPNETDDPVLARAPERSAVGAAQGTASLSVGADIDATQELLRPPLPSSTAPPSEPHADPASAQDVPTTGRGRPASSASNDEAPELTGDGLPRRVRQNRIARRVSAAARSVHDAGPAFRSPEQARAAMSALQAGTVRGRRDAEALPPMPRAPETPADAVATRPAETTSEPSEPSGPASRAVVTPSAPSSLAGDGASPDSERDE